MDISAIRDEIRLKLTGFVLEIEISDETVDRIIHSCLRELQRYICSTNIVTIPFSSCIDLSQMKDSSGKPLKISSISRIYRADSFGKGDVSLQPTDPMLASQWQLISGVGNLRDFQDYVYNYSAYMELMQIRNTTSTDLSFRYDKPSNKLYIVISTNTPTYITIEYVPKLETVDDVVSDYWLDILIRMCVATTKIVVGRIRSRYTQNGAIWSQDGSEILQEGNTELTALREQLKADTQLVYGID